MSTRTLSQIIDKHLNVREEEKICTLEDVKSLFVRYCNGEIDETQFDDLFYLYYVRDGIQDEVTSLQKKVFDDLGDVRYSPFPEDLQTGVYINAEEYRKEILKAKQALGF